jgi:hypothetical protein
MKLAAAIYLAVLLVFVGRLAARSPVVGVPRTGGETPRPGYVVNLAARSAGARVESSDYDVFNGHHPLYAIDEEPSPTPEEKWASLRTPAWLEVILAAPSDVEWVRLTLAGAHEDASFNVRDFDVVCGGQRIRVRGNSDPRPRVLLGCAGADRVRFEFPSAPPPLDRARVYEAEVWGAVR